MRRLHGTLHRSSFCIAHATSHLFEEGSALLIAACSVCTEDIGCKSESCYSVCSFLPCSLSIVLSLHTCMVRFPPRRSAGRASGSELDMKYATQSMEYEVRSMKRAGKRVAKSVEEQGKEQGRAREERGKSEE